MDLLRGGFVKKFCCVILCWLGKVMCGTYYMLSAPTEPNRIYCPTTGRSNLHRKNILKSKQLVVVIIYLRLFSDQFNNNNV